MENNPIINLNNCQLERVHEFKYLGIKIYDNLKYQWHIDYLSMTDKLSVNYLWFFLLVALLSGDYLQKCMKDLSNQNLNCTQKNNRKVGQKRFLKKKVKSRPSPPFKKVNFFHQI